jgi:hypothetical protein
LSRPGRVPISTTFCGGSPWVLSILRSILCISQKHLFPPESTDEILALSSFIAAIPSYPHFAFYFNFLPKTPWQNPVFVVYCRHKDEGSESSDGVEHDGSASELVGRFEGLWCVILQYLFWKEWCCISFTSGTAGENRYYGFRRIGPMY